MSEHVKLVLQIRQLEVIMKNYYKDTNKHKLNYSMACSIFTSSEVMMDSEGVR